MKNKFILTAFVIVFTALVVSSCKKDEDSLSDKLSGLKAVNFPEKSEEVLETKLLRELGDGQKEILQLVRKSMSVDPVNVVEDSKLDVIYPGSILRGDSFMEGELDPIAIAKPKEITISISLKGEGLNVKRTTLPSVSNIRQQLNDLSYDKIDHNNVPSYLEYESNSVNTYGSFNKTLKAHVRASALFGLVKGSLHYETSELSINQTKYVLIKVRQFFYNVAVDPKPYNEWGDLEQSSIGDYEPVYVSSVDYGRVAHLLVKTNMTAEETYKQISGSIRAGWFLVKAGGSVEMNDATKKMFQSGEIKVMTLGGPLTYGKDIQDLDTFIRFLQAPTAEELVKSAAPISYKIRTLKDNKTVHVRSFYTEQRVIRVK
jgi:flavomodulin